VRRRIHYSVWLYKGRWPCKELGSNAVLLTFFSWVRRGRVSYVGVETKRRLKRFHHQIFLTNLKSTTNHLPDKYEKSVRHLFVSQLCALVCLQVCCTNVMVETHLNSKHKAPSRWTVSQAGSSHLSAHTLSLMALMFGLDSVISSAVHGTRWRLL
jgi:hypothetical protein